MKNQLIIAIVIIVVLLLFVIGYHLFKAYRSFKAYMLYRQADVTSEENVDMAIKLLEQAVKINPNKPEFRWNLASMYYIQNRIDDAISQLKHLLKQDPNALSVNKLLIMALLEKGDKKTLKEICKTINKLDQDPVFYDILKSLKETCD